MAEDKKKNVSELDKTLVQSEGEIRGAQKKSSQVPYLVIAQGPHQGHKFPLSVGDNTIGRKMGSEVLLEDQSVSRAHSIITQSREGWTVEDQGSKNGTLVNGQLITEKVNIGHGDVVQIGIYSLRLITKEVSREEESKPLPPEWEGKTVMMSSPPQDDTKTGVEESIEEESEAEKKIEGVAEEEREEKRELVVPEEEVSEVSKKKKRPIWWTLLMIVLLFAVVAGAGGYLYLKFFHKPAKEIVEPIKKPDIKAPLPEKDQKIPDGKVPEGKTPEGTTPGEKPAEGPVATPVKKEEPRTVPVFLDFASSPLPAKVTFQDKDYGMTPIKVQVSLDVDKSYKAEAEFDLKEMGEKYKEEISFDVSREEPLVPILFKGPIGVLKVMELPKDVELYLEGNYIYDPFNAKTAKLENLVFGKPTYIPFGKYIVELRQGKELAGSGEFVRDIRYKREILVTEDAPVFVLKVTEEDLNEFPVEIKSIPTNADVFMDAKKVGKTPYKGIFPLGEHTLTLRKDGYFEHKQDLKIDINVPFKTEIALKTTVSGEFVNTGKHLMQKGQYKEAIEKLSEVFKSTPTPGEVAQARYLIGSCFIHLGDLATAEGYFKQAVENEDMKHPSMLGLVSVYSGLNKKSDAIPHLIEVMLNSKDKTIQNEAAELFKQISPLHSIMYVHSEPEGAKVFLNDKPINQVTPMILPDLALGNYRVRIEKDGYIPQELSINMTVNEFNPVAVKLKKVPE